jgi:hypothetical protein
VPLTAKRVERLRRRPGRHGDGHGLYLQVQKSATGKPSASWVLRYQRHHKEHFLGLGPLHVVGLKQARERAKAARLQLLDDIDPVERKRQIKQEKLVATARALTFQQAMQAYFLQYKDRCHSNTHRAQYISSL